MKEKVAYCPWYLVCFYIMFSLIGKTRTPGTALNYFTLLLVAVQLFVFARADAADYSSARNQAGRAAAATLRIGKHANYLRLVFETAESYVQRASVGLSGENTIKIDFQSPVSFRVPQKDAPKSFVKVEADSGKRVTYEIDKGIRIDAETNGCTIYIDNLDDINVSKLPSPSRLVIDAYLAQASGAAGNAAFTDAPALPVPDASDIKFESFVIDAGHGGSDNGVRFAKVLEKDVALSFAKEFYGALLRKGKKVSLTRKVDQTLSLRDRARIVNKKSPDLFISIHVSSKDELAAYSLSRQVALNGVETAAASPEKTAATEKSEAVAQSIVQSARNALKMGVRSEKLPLPLLSYVHVPVVLIELPSPDKFSYDAKSRERLIGILLQGIAYSSTGQAGA